MVVLERGVLVLSVWVAFFSNGLIVSSGALILAVGSFSWR
jgi:hypothetical protein